MGSLSVPNFEAIKLHINFAFIVKCAKRRKVLAPIDPLNKQNEENIQNFGCPYLTNGYIELVVCGLPYMAGSFNEKMVCFGWAMELCICKSRIFFFPVSAGQ